MNEQDTSQPTPQPLTERYEALDQILGFHHVLWLATFALWRCEHERTGQGLTYETIEPLSGLGQFVTETAHVRARELYEYTRDLGQRSEDTLKRAYELIEEHKQARAAEEKKE